MLREVLDVVIFVGGLAGIIAASYRFFATEHQQERHHKTLLGKISAASQVNWLEATISQLVSIGRLFDRVYGVANGSDDRFCAYLNARSWRASALIVGAYLVITPHLALFLLGVTLLGRAIFQWLILGADPPIINFTVILIILYPLSVVAAVGFLGWRFRRFAANLPRASSFSETALRVLKFSFLLGLVIGISFLIVGSEALGIAAISGRMVQVFNWSVAAFLVVFMAIMFMHAIWRNGFFSPLVIAGVAIGTFPFAVASLLSGVIYYAIFLVFRDIIIDEGVFISQMEFNVPGSFALGCMFIVSIIQVMLTVKLFFARNSSYLGLFATAFSLVSITALSFVFVSIDNSAETSLAINVQGFLDTFLSLIFLVIFFLIFTYTPIVSNSVPDMLSVAFTRFCVRRAARSSSFAELLKYLILDAFLAFFCVLVSLSLMLIGVEAFGESIRAIHMTRLFENEIFAEAALLATYSDLSELIQYAHAVFFDSIAFWRSGRPIDPMGSNRDLIALVVIGFAFTGALPSILNAVLLSYTMIARAFLLVVGKATLKLHSLLTERGDKGELVGQWRSIALISVSASALIAASFSLLDDLFG